MAITDKEALSLIQEYKTKQENLFKRYHQQTVDRYCVVEIQKKNAILVDVNSSFERLKSRLDRFSILLNTSYEAPDDIRAAMRAVSVVVVDNEVKLLMSLVPLTPYYKQQKLKLNTVVSSMTISTHAILRWLTRNNSRDVENAIINLGHALVDVDREIGLKMVLQNLVPVGFNERQVKTRDGGIAFVIVPNPEVGQYKHAEMAVLTYISSDMMMDWNKQAIAQEYDNLHKATDYDDYLSTIKHFMEQVWH